MFLESVTSLSSSVATASIFFIQQLLQLSFRGIIIEAMLVLIRNKQLFSKNYVNAFKVRARLAEFFKHIHPDQMVQAPTKIKDENLRSLKNFNSYLDSINQQKPIEGKLLKFYISEKTNHKSRKFFSFNLELPELNSEQAKLNQQKAGKLIDDIVNALNSKFKESRNILEGKKKEKVDPVEPEVASVETEEEKLNRKQETIGPFTKNNTKWSVEQERLRKAINAKYMENQRQNLKLKLRKNMSFANTSTNKPMMWSRIIMNESGIYDDYQQILNNLLDPKLIYFSQDIHLPQIEEFKKKLLPGQMDRMGIRSTNAILEVCQEMEEFTPPVCLYVTTHYSATEIPGFFSIPYNFVPTELNQKWKQCKATIIAERTKYEQLYDHFQDLSKELKQYNKMVVTQPVFKNNQDISTKIQVLQRLKKYVLNNETKIHMLEAEDFRILCQQYQLDQKLSVHIINDSLFLSIRFEEDLLKASIDNLNEIKPQRADFAS